MNPATTILPAPVNKFLFLIVLFLLFSASFILLILLDNSYKIWIQGIEEFLLLSLILFSFPANIYLSGTGIIIYSLASLSLCFLNSLIFENVFLFFSIPLLISIQIYSRRIINRFSIEQHEKFLEMEKIRESLNDKASHIKNLRQKYIALEHQISRFTNLRNYISKINLSLSTEHIYENILNFVNECIPQGDVYFLSCLNEHGELSNTNFIVKERSQNVLLRNNKSDLVNDWVLNYHSPLRITDLNEDYRFQSDRTVYPLVYAASSSIIASPLISDDKMMGIIRIDATQPDTFHMNDFRLLVLIANISALSLKNAELFKETQKLSITDGLTGLYLNHFMLEEMQKLAQMPLDNKPLNSFCFIMMDLDNFKQVNDKYGHVVGDNILKHTSSIISKHCPQPGFAVRYGGEEFAMILPSLNKNEAFDLAEKIRTSVSDKKFFIRRETVVTTLSIGIAEYPSDTKDLRTLIQKADERMYAAKKRGKNNTVIHL